MTDAPGDGAASLSARGAACRVGVDLLALDHHILGLKFAAELFAHIDRFIARQATANNLALVCGGGQRHDAVGDRLWNRHDGFIPRGLTKSWPLERMACNVLWEKVYLHRNESAVRQCRTLRLRLRHVDLLHSSHSAYSWFVLSCAAGN